MDTYSDFVQFSQDLYLYNTDIIVSHEDREPLKPTDFISAASQTLDLFRDAFCVQFHNLYKKHVPKNLVTDEQFLIYTIPRCLKLVDDDRYYFSILLVAAFIQELVYYFDLKKNCYRFSGTAYKSLVAVLKRRFEPTFEDKGGWKGLETFCNRSRFEDTQKHRRLSNYLTGGDYAHTRRVLQLIKECGDVQDERFELNDYELSLLALEDQLAIRAYINDYITVPEDSPDQPDRGKQDGNEKSSDTITDETNFRPFSRSNSESPSDSDTLSESSDIESPNSDTASGSENQRNSNEFSEFDITVIRSTRVAFRKRDPKICGKTLSERMCKWCNTMCYEYAKYFYRQHRDLSLKPEKVSDI